MQTNLVGQPIEIVRDDPSCKHLVGRQGIIRAICLSENTEFYAVVELDDDYILYPIFINHLKCLHGGINS